jgi:hypothetical protein
VAVSIDGKLIKCLNSWWSDMCDHGYFYLDVSVLRDQSRIMDPCIISVNTSNMSTNFSRYIDWLIAWPAIDVDKAYGAQCVDSCREIAKHLGYPITSYGDAWEIYLKWSKWYYIEQVWSYIPLPWDLVFMKPSPANGRAWHIAIADEGCTMSRYNVVHQNYGVQGKSGSGVGDRHLKRQNIPAQQWGGILARDHPFARWDTDTLR